MDTVKEMEKGKGENAMPLRIPTYRSFRYKSMASDVRRSGESDDDDNTSFEHPSYSYD